MPEIARYPVLYGVHHALASDDKVSAKRLMDSPQVVGRAALISSTSHVLRWWQCIPDEQRPASMIERVREHEGDLQCAREHEALFHVFMQGGFIEDAHAWARSLGQSTEPFTELEAIYLKSFTYEIDTLRALGRFDEARERSGAHIAVTSDRFGIELEDGSVDCGESMEVTAAWRNSAYVELDDGCFEMASDLLTEVLRIMRKHVGEAHPEALKVLYNLAMAYTGLEAHDEALSLHERCFALRAQSLGLGHIDTIRSWKTLLDEEAEDACGGVEELWEVATLNLGPYHKEVIDILRLRARAKVSEDGDPEAAFALFDACLERLEAAPAMDHDTLIRVLSDRARLFRMQEDYDAACVAYQRLQGAFAGHYGADNPKTIEVGIPIAYVHFDRGCVVEGLSTLEDTVRRFEESENAPAYWLSGTLEMLADAYVEHGKPEDAVAIYRRVIALEDDDEVDFELRMTLGVLLDDLGWPKEAKELLTLALEGVEDDAECDPDVVIPAMETLAKLLGPHSSRGQALSARVDELIAIWEDDDE